MDRREPRPGEGGRDSPVSRLERALRAGNWRGGGRSRGERPLPAPVSPARRHLRKRILAVLLLLVLVVVVAAVIAEPRLLNRGELAVLVLGRDDAAGRGADTIAFARADLARARVTLLSVPADTWIAGADGEGRTAGALVGNPEGVTRLARRLYLVRPSHRVTFRSDLLPRLVHAVGGVDIDVGPVPLNSYDEAGTWHVHIAAGQQHFRGEQAAGYLRYREAQPSPCPVCGATWKKAEGAQSADAAIVARQQALLGAVLAKLRGPALLWRAPRALRAMRKADHDLTFRQVIALGNCLRRSKAPVFAVYPTQVAGRRLLPLPEQTSRLENAVGSILAGRVVVRNGAGSPGLAGRVAEHLARKGFLVMRPENTARTPRTTIEGPAELGREVQQVLGYGSCAYRDSKDVVVTIGLDAPNPE